jgi:capsid protein
MSIWNPFDWFGKKTTPYNLGMTLGMSRDKVHPERKVSVSETNKEANTLRYSNDMVSAYSKAVKRGVVGTGFSLQFKTDDNNINAQAEDWLKYCSEKGNADFTKRFFRQKLERMIADELAIKGGVLIRHHWDKRFPTLYAPEILSMDTIDRKKYDFSKGLYSGIQINNFGQITGIWIYKNNERLSSVFVPIKNLELEVLEFDPHQYGNISPLATIMLRMDDISTYTTEELKNAKKRAEKSLVAATPAVDKFLTAQEEYMQAMLKQYGEDSTQFERAKQDYKKALQEFSAPGFHDAAEVMMEGTQIFDLQQNGTSEYNNLSINSKQTISKGMGYSAASIMGIPENSYNSALKSAQEEEEENAIIGQSVLAVTIQIYRRQVEAGVILGEIDILDYFTRKRYYDRKLSATRKIKGHIDPLKQINADAAEVEAELESIIQKLANKNRDYEDVIDDNVRYELTKKAKFEEAGLEYIQTGTEKIAQERAKAYAQAEAQEDLNQQTEETE